ncbi:uncharacterized protein LOC129905205 [Episyrphus balteatus]|uniref:uncharacterized protein LOC129905205 n=1 Tax=Episyrphus balteatus TaxID=286459 RepID=UPI002485A1B7|nr:uncharacterized protein LOC129905205 [Episyrphus balteatus]
MSKKSNNNKNLKKIVVQRDVTASDLASQMERDLHGDDSKPGCSKKGAKPKQHKKNRLAQGAVSSEASSGSIPPKVVEDGTRAEVDAKDGNKPSEAESTPSTITIKARTNPNPGSGGQNDSLYRDSLSGASKKWYSRFLRQGLSREEAKKKMEERKLANSSEPPKSQDQGKRKSSQITPPQRQEVKKPRTNATVETGLSTVKAGAEALGLSYASVATGIKVAVLPKDFPEASLSADELSTLEEAIIEEVSLGWTHKLKFNGLHYRTGFLLVDCVGQPTADWLKLKASELQNWKGTELMACLGDDIPKMQHITVFLPKSSGQEDRKSLALIQAQNEGLAIQAWKVLKSTAEGKGQLMVISIDSKSTEAIVKAQHELHYKFGKIGVSGLKKPSVPTTLHKPGNVAPEGTQEVEMSDAPIPKSIIRPTRFPTIDSNQPNETQPTNSLTPLQNTQQSLPSGSQADSLDVMGMEKVRLDDELEGMDLTLSQAGSDVLPTEEEENHLLADEGAIVPIC